MSDPYQSVFPQDGDAPRLVTFTFKARRVVGPTTVLHDKRDAPPQPPQTQPNGILNSGNLPDCNLCAVRCLCSQHQSANYYAKQFVFSFARPECEAALSDKVDLVAVLNDAPQTMAQLHKLTGRSFASLSRDLRACAARIVGYGARGEAIYGIRGPDAGQRLEIRDLILMSLKECGPQTTNELSQRCHAHISTIRRTVRGLAQAELISEIAKCKFRAPSGIVRQAPIWQINDSDTA